MVWGDQDILAQLVKHRETDIAAPDVEWQEYYTSEGTSTCLMVISSVLLILRGCQVECQQARVWLYLPKHKTIADVAMTNNFRNDWR